MAEIRLNLTNGGGGSRSWSAWSGREGSTRCGGRFLTHHEPKGAQKNGECPGMQTPQTGWVALASKSAWVK